VPCEVAEQWRSFDPGVSPKDRAKKCLLFFYDLPNAKVREYNAHYFEAEVILLGQLLHPHTDTYGNRDSAEHLCKRSKIFDRKRADISLFYSMDVKS